MTKGKPRASYLRAVDAQEKPAAKAQPAAVVVPLPGPVPPAHLTEAELEIWNELLLTVPADLLQTINPHILGMLVKSTIKYRAAAKLVNEYGTVIKSPSGYPIQSPYEAIMNKQAEHILKFMVSLGLANGARQRGKGGGNNRPNQQNPFAGLKHLGE